MTEEIKPEIDGLSLDNLIDKLCTLRKECGHGGYVVYSCASDSELMYPIEDVRKDSSTGTTDIILDIGSKEEVDESDPVCKFEIAGDTYVIRKQKDE